MSEGHDRWIARTLEIARSAVAHGNHPFGALLLDDSTGRVVLEAENCVFTERDCTGHAETTLCRLASKSLDKEVIERCTLYTSTEPCVMCAGAIHWLGVKRVVYGCPESELYRIVGEHEDNRVLRLPMAKMLELSGAKCTLIGPVLEKLAVAVHEEFDGWKQ